MGSEVFSSLVRNNPSYIVTTLGRRLRPCFNETKRLQLFTYHCGIVWIASIRIGRAAETHAAIGAPLSKSLPNRPVNPTFRRLFEKFIVDSKKYLSKGCADRKTPLR